MAAINPNAIFTQSQAMAQQWLNDPHFASLSPEYQQQLQQLATDPYSAIQNRSVSIGPLLQELNSKGFPNTDPGMQPVQALMLLGGMIGGAGVGAALTGGGAAAEAGASPAFVGPTQTGVGVADIGPGLAAPTMATTGPAVGGGSSLLGAGAKTLLGTIGSGISGATQAAATNRGQKLGAEQEQEKIDVQREQEDRASLSDAWRKILASSYVQNNTTPYSPAVGGMPNFGIAMKPYGADPNVIKGSQGMQAEAMKRATGGSTLPPAPDINKLSSPSLWEQIGNWAGPILTGISGLGKK